jgi:alanyl-tRNA synthetase
MASSNDIRAAFLDYFARNGHQVVESSPLVPRNDPTLMFANSGMVQFKNVFTGQEKRPYVCATTAQKCVRAGGKHNDLDNVGYTARHHTFFEMLGNFSFGDYFKEMAIPYAWELITKDFALPRDRLTVTVYSEDDDAAEIWRKVSGLPDDRIIRIATSDNFWRMGDTGPCGPSSEIFYDHGPSIPGGPPGSPDQDGDRFVEVWNLVFMQFEEGPPGTRIALPRPSIDTGMGLERLAAILQGKHDNYDTDTLRALILASAEATGQDPDGPFRASHRVVADHLRSVAFLIADGVLPSNEGRGYVLRRIVRRAVRHGRILGRREPFMADLGTVVIEVMGTAYPHIVERVGEILSAISREEDLFSRTLDSGSRWLEFEIGQLFRPGPEEGRGPALPDRVVGRRYEQLPPDSRVLPGDIAFRLHDTYGFPIDLTIELAAEYGVAVDRPGFDAALAEQRERSRSGKKAELAKHAELTSLYQAIQARAGDTQFLGYETTAATGMVVAIVRDGMEFHELTGQGAAEAFNVVATVAGQQTDLAPIVVITPRSGWWQCASERGGGLACSTTFTLMRCDTTGGECGTWFLSPNTSCNVCSPGVSDTSASVWPAPKCRCWKSFGISALSAGVGASTIK